MHRLKKKTACGDVSECCGAGNVGNEKKNGWRCGGGGGIRAKSLPHLTSDSRPQLEPITLDTHTCIHTHTHTHIMFPFFSPTCTPPLFFYLTIKPQC